MSNRIALADQSVVVSGEGESVKRPSETSTQAIKTNRYFCPFLSRRRGCRRGNRCHFSHDENSIRIPSKYCIKFMANRCLVGPNCRLLHSEPDASGDLDRLARGRNQSAHLGQSQRDGCSQEPRIFVNSDQPTTIAPECRPHVERQQKTTPTRVLVAPTRPLEIPEDFKRRHKSLGCQAPWEQLTLDLYLLNRDKKCGICLEKIIEKRPFHSNRWQDHLADSCDVDGGVTCPECRRWSSLVIPANYWFKDHEEKMRLLEKYLSDNDQFRFITELTDNYIDCEFYRRRRRRRELSRHRSEQELWSWVYDAPFARSHSSDDCFVSLKMILFIVSGLTMWYIRTALTD